MGAAGVGAPIAHAARVPVGRPVKRALPGWVRRHQRASVTADLAAALAGGHAAVLLRFGEIAQPHVTPYVLLGLALPMPWLATLALLRAYEPRLIGDGSDEFRRVAHAGFLLIAAVAIGAYVTKTDLARGYVILALPVITVISLMARYGLRRRLHRRRARGQCMRRVVAVGHREAVEELVDRFRRERYHGMEIVAACLPGGDGTTVDQIPVCGDFSDVALAVRQAHADTVAVLACPEMDGTALRRLAWRLEKTQTDLVVASALMEVAGPRTTIRAVAGLPLLHVEHPELTGPRKVIKSGFDRLVGGLAVLLLLPLLGFIALAVLVSSPGPVLFRQTRVGRDGRTFTLYKFRTMVVNAEARRTALINESDGPLFKIRRDPRVTALGARLRRYSLDELPQLVNVVRGDMSLVGPRPPLPAEVAAYGDDVRRRLVVKPGLTGLWQVSGRADLSWEESVRLDLRYVENWSLMLDLQILWKTWSAVVRGAGAY